MSIGDKLNKLVEDAAINTTKLDKAVVGPIQSHSGPETGDILMVRHHLDTDRSELGIAMIVKRQDSDSPGEFQPPESYMYEVRDHLGHAVASGRCRRFDHAAICADVALYQFGYLEDYELVNIAASLLHPIAGLLPQNLIEKINKLVNTDKPKQFFTTGDLIRIPYSDLAMVLTEGDMMLINKILAKNTKPHDILQLLIPDSATTTDALARSMAHYTHGNAQLPTYTRRAATIKRKIRSITLHGSHNRRKEFRKELEAINDHIHKLHGSFPQFNQEKKMNIDDIDLEEEGKTMIERVFQDPTLLLAADGLLDGGKMVAAVKTQRLFQKMARKIATRLIGEDNIGVLDTAGGDILISLCMPLAVHAVATKGPAMGIKVPVAQPLANMSDIAFRGQVVRIGLQYAPELTDIYDLVSDEISELTALAVSLFGSGEEKAPAESPKLADQADAEAISNLKPKKEGVPLPMPELQKAGGS